MLLQTLRRPLLSPLLMLLRLQLPQPLPDLVPLPLRLLLLLRPAKLREQTIQSWRLQQAGRSRAA